MNGAAPAGDHTGTTGRAGVIYAARGRDKLFTFPARGHLASRDRAGARALNFHAVWSGAGAGATHKRTD